MGEFEVLLVGYREEFESVREVPNTWVKWLGKYHGR